MGQQEKQDETRNSSADEKQQGGQHADDGLSGEGAASAMAHMISQGRKKRRNQSGEADDAAGHPQ